VAWIVGALEGAAVLGGLSAIGAALFSIGIPKNSVIDYETAIKTDRYLVLVHGMTAEVQKAKDVLTRTRPVSLNLHAEEMAAV
jgi:hypothetical protein